MLISPELLELLLRRFDPEVAARCCKASSVDFVSRSFGVVPCSSGVGDGMLGFEPGAILGAANYY